MSIPEDIDGLVCLDNLARGAKDRYDKELARIAQARAPFQMGATVLVNGWSYRGKQMVVDHMGACFRTLAGGYRLEVKATGFVLSTLGQPTKLRATSEWSEVYKC